MSDQEPIEYLSPVAAGMILAALPGNIKKAFKRRAAEIEYPVEAVLEMALAGFFDSESLSFTDCTPIIEAIYLSFYKQTCDCVFLLPRC